MNRYNYYDLEESVKMVEEVVREESKRYHNGSENNIYLMGFSQGACLAL
jgi:predicted esterase